MDACIRFAKKRGMKYAGALVLALFAVAFFDVPRPTHAESERVITIHHDGTQETVVTNAKTVGEVLQRAQISLNAHDEVEPAANFHLAAPGYDVNVYRARPITIADGPKIYQIMSARTSAKQIAADAGVMLYDEDSYKLTRIDDFVTEGGVGLKLTIQRSVPVTLNLYGKSISTRTLSETVEDLIKEKGITLADNEGVNLPLSAQITPNITIQVWRNGVQTTTEEQDIAFPVRQIRDTNQPLGYKQVQTPGTNGKKLVTYEIEMRSGAEVSRKEIQSVVTLQPKEQVEVVGTKVPANLSDQKNELMAAAGIVAGDYGYVDYIVTRESGWCPTKLQGHPGACPGVAPDVIPSSLGYGMCQATPGSKMATAGDDWRTNPITQLRWCSSYAKSRYGSWAAAYNHWLTAHSW
jgi:resuscitation-promoting factor RpfB